jgi:hypothetical protein
LSRLRIALAALMLLACTPSAFAAGIAPVTGDHAPGGGRPVRPAHPSPSHAEVLHRERIAAYRAYLLARHAGWQVGVRVAPPLGIRRAHTVAGLRRLRHAWLVRLWRYHRITHRRGAVVHAALGQLGTPYRWGGASPGGFDCSGLVVWSYSRIGVRLPHSTSSLIRLGRSVRRSAIRPGDLVFTRGGGHVGIYIGRGLVEAAPHSGARVDREPLSSWWIDAIRRIL